MASDRPSSDIVFSVKPKAQTATNEASTDTGSARPVMTVERHELRNRNTTSTVSAAPSTSAFCTSATELVTRGPVSRATTNSTPGGSVRLDGVDLLADARADVGGAGAVGLDDVDADGVAAVVDRADVRGSSVAVAGDGDVAEADQAAAALGDDQPREVGRLVQAAAQADGALVERPLRRPTGAARFCVCSASTTSPTPTPVACSARGSSSTVSSRSMPPTTRTSATPLTPRSWLVTPGSAIRVSSRPGQRRRRQRRAGRSGSRSGRTG